MRPKNPREMTRAEMVTAGATVLHVSPFSDLPVPDPPSGEVACEVWQQRAFSDGHFSPASLRALSVGNLDEIDVEFVRTLLSVFDWRPRLAAAYLCVVKNYVALEPLIGTLLLRSDVCYAGRGYCLALARFGTDSAVEYLRRYLAYYLTRSDLDFNQVDAMAALVCHDRVRQTAYAAEYRDAWATWASAERADAWLEERVRLMSAMLDAASGNASS